MGRKPEREFTTVYEKETYEKSRKKDWDLMNRDKIHEYRKQRTIERCMKTYQLPAQKTRQIYKISAEEMGILFKNFMNCPVDVLKKKQDSLNDIMDIHYIE